MNFIKKLLFALSVIAITSAGIYLATINAINTKTQDNSTSSSSVNEYIAELKKEEQVIWDELKQIDITPELCNSLKEQYSKEYNQQNQEFIDSLISPEPLTDSMQTLTYQTLDDFGISRQAIQLISSNLDCPAIIGGDTCICINEKIMKSFPKNVQQFIIAHELQHIIYGDDSTRFVIEKFLGTEVFPIAHPFVKLAKFQEKRADILAACKNQSYTQGEIDFMERLKKIEDPEETNETYPTAQERLVFGKEILERIKHSSVA